MVRRLAMLLMCVASLAASANAQLPRPKFVDAETEQAISESLKWLADQQDETTGAFGTQHEFTQNVGVTALAGLAFLSSGSTPGEGPYGDVLDRITNYLLDCAAPNGFIIEPNTQSQSPMYGHGFATTYLAEVYGMSEHPKVREKLKQAVKLIIASQNSEGGWRYFPTPDEADISVTACQVIALRAARNAGISVPKEIIDKAVTYINKCQNNDGGFRYRVLDAAESRFPRSAAAVVALYTAGAGDSATIERGLSYMMRHVPGPRTPKDLQYHYYAQYYAAQAAWHAGGEHWSVWYPAARNELMRTRVPGRGWSDPWVGDDFATAMALIALQIPYDYVPILER
ncbi:MAG: terpene cyclase/mutase family protein [Planctomycetaceae bacterium]|nr:terpene cyclase/mutase family protein [Planctomycetaceae bacterium]MCB9950548.1 terpene cyclase/mutase family protein [Planctomycetaceae bacterium]